MNGRLHALTLGAALTALLPAAADEVAWQGSDKASWNAAENWDGGAVPTEADVAVFDPGSGAALTVTFADVSDVRGVKVLSGTVTLGGSDADGKYLRMHADSTGCSDAFVADGATLAVRCGMLPARPNRSVFRKTGAGTIAFYGPLGDVNGWIQPDVRQGFAQIDVAGGLLRPDRDGSVFYATNVIVRDGATWSNTRYNTMMYGSPDVHLEKGGTFRTYNDNDILGSVTGEGLLDGTGSCSCTITLERGPCRFDGRLGTAAVGNDAAYRVTFGAQGTKTDENYAFIVGNTNVMSGLSAIAFAAEPSPRAVTNCPIRFAAGIGRFDFFVLNCKRDAPLVLEDVEGNPVDVYATNLGDVGGTFANADLFAVSGRGNLYVRHRPGEFRRQAVPFTGRMLRLTGEVGASDDGCAVFGDGTAGRDPDLSTVSRIVARDPGSCVAFSNFAPQTVPCPLDVRGTLQASGAALTVAEFATAAERPVVVQSRTNLTLAAGNGDSWIGRVDAVSPASGTVSFTQGLFHSNHVAQAYNDGRSLDEPGGFGIGHPSFGVADGATVWVDGDRSQFSRVTVGPGGILYQNSAFPGSTKGYGSITLDGGDHRVFYVRSNGEDPIPNGTNEVWTFRVTERGGRLSDDGNWRLRGGSKVVRPELRAAFASGAAEGKTPGELTLSFMNVVKVYRPLTTGGDVRLESGCFNPIKDAVSSTAFSDGTFFGTKDLALGCAAVNFGTMTADMKPKFVASGGKLRMAAPALICGRTATYQPQTMTFGDGTDDPFVREEGGFLVISDAKSIGLSSFDGKGVKAIVNGAKADVDPATGVLRDPVFGAVLMSGSGSYHRFDFLTQGSGGLLAACTYATGVLSGPNTIARVGTATTLASSAQVAGLNLDAGPLTIGSGCTLKVGKDDTEHPACVLTHLKASGGAAARGDVLGDGTLDFGASEGLVVAGRPDGSLNACAINCRIAGTGGLSIGGVSRQENGASALDLGGENTYAGDTRVGGTEVRARSLGAFSSSHVRVAGGTYNGGRIRFLKAGTYANEWTVGGIGSLLFSNKGLEPGCLVFNADVTLAGPVRVDRMARFSTSNSQTELGDGHACTDNWFDPGTGTFAGEISGGEVQIAGSQTANYGRKPIVFTHHNTYTGGTAVVGYDLILRGDGDCGTGKVSLSDGARLICGHDAEKTLPNDLEGVGTVKLAGSSPVHFTGRVRRESWCDLRLDLADTAPVFTEAPPFAVVTNSSALRVHVTLRGNMRLDPSDYAYLEPNARVTADGGEIDLCGGTLSVYCVERLNGGRFVNGTVIEVNPIHGLSVFILR